MLISSAELWVSNSTAVTLCTLNSNVLIFLVGYSAFELADVQSIAPCRLFVGARPTGIVKQERKTVRPKGGWETGSSEGSGEGHMRRRFKVVSTRACQQVYMYIHMCFGQVGPTLSFVCSCPTQTLKKRYSHKLSNAREL